MFRVSLCDPLRSDNFLRTGQSANFQFADWNASKRPLATSPSRPLVDVGGRYRIDIRMSPAPMQRTFTRIPYPEVRWPFQTIRIVGKGKG